MKSKWSIVIAVLFVLTFFVFTFAVKTNNDKCISSRYGSDAGRYRTVIVDAGHGGEDGGAVAGSILEKDINLSVSKKLESALKLMGFNVIMTRTRDKLEYGGDAKSIRQKKVSDIHYRTELANKTQNAVLISIHQNKFPQSKYSGTQVFYAPNGDESEYLAENIQACVHGLLQPDNARRIKESGTNIYLLYNAKIPAVMVECGFLSNNEEREKLLQDEYQDKMVFCIMCGILKSISAEEE